MLTSSAKGIASPESRLSALVDFEPPVRVLNTVNIFSRDTPLKEALHGLLVSCKTIQEKNITPLFIAYNETVTTLFLDSIYFEYQMMLREVRAFNFKHITDIPDTRLKEHASSIMSHCTDHIEQKLNQIDRQLSLEKGLIDNPQLAGAGLYYSQQEVLQDQTIAQALDGLLDNFKQLSTGNPVNYYRKVFISYAWPKLAKEKIEDFIDNESWVQPFLRGLRGHLRAAGIEAILDIADNTHGRSIIEFMQSQTNQVDYILMIGTPSLLHKHLQGTSIVCDELNKISLRRQSDRANSRNESILPIVVYGDTRESLPGDNERYATVRDWTKQSYISNLQNLLDTLHEQPNQSRQDVWKQHLGENYDNLMRPFQKDAVEEKYQLDSQSQANQKKQQVQEDRKRLMSLGALASIASDNSQSSSSASHITHQPDDVAHYNTLGAHNSDIKRFPTPEFRLGNETSSIRKRFIDKYQNFGKIEWMIINSNNRDWHVVDNKNYKQFNHKTKVKLNFRLYLSPTKIKSDSVYCEAKVDIFYDKQMHKTIYFSYEPEHLIKPEPITSDPPIKNKLDDKLANIISRHTNLSYSINLISIEPHVYYKVATITQMNMGEIDTIIQDKDSRTLIQVINLAKEIDDNNWINYIFEHVGVREDVGVNVEHMENICANMNYGNVINRCAHYGFYEGMKLILEHYPSEVGVNYYDYEYGTTPLFKSLCDSQWEIAVLLLGHGANPNLGNNGAVREKYLGYVPLNIIITALLTINPQDENYLEEYEKRFNVLKALLEHGADPNLRQGNYGNALETLKPHASSSPHTAKKVLNLLLKYSADINLLEAEAKEVLQRLLEEEQSYGAKRNINDKAELKGQPKNKRARSESDQLLMNPLISGNNDFCSEDERIANKNPINDLETIDFAERYIQESINMERFQQGIQASLYESGSNLSTNSQDELAGQNEGISKDQPITRASQGVAHNSASMFRASSLSLMQQDEQAEAPRNKRNYIS